MRAKHGQTSINKSGDDWSRTGLREVDCGSRYIRDEDVALFSSLLQCASLPRAPHCSQCLDCSVWITTGTGANYPFFSFIGDILEEIIERHLQFQDEVDDEAREAVEAAARQRNVDIETSLHLMVGVHVRRTDFHYYSKNWMADLLNETFYQEAMRYMRTKFQAVTFLVVSDDQEWCRHHLQARYIQAFLSSVAVWSTLIGRGSTRLGSHWSRAS